MNRYATSDKIVTLDALAKKTGELKRDGQSIVWTNGCFDILHAGHVTYLQGAAAEADVLVVGLNSDASVRTVKGPGRPVVPEDERAIVIAGLGCVDYVVVFSDENTVPMLDLLRPEVYAKGGDYTIDTIDQDERRLVEGYGGRIALLPGIEGRSTTDLIDRLSDDSR